MDINLKTARAIMKHFLPAQLPRIKDAEAKAAAIEFVAAVDKAVEAAITKAQ